MIQVVLLAATFALPPSLPNPCVVAGIPMDGQIQECIYAPDAGRLLWVTAWIENFQMECYARGYTCFKRETMNALLGVK